MHLVIGNLGSRLLSYRPGGDGQTHSSVISVRPASQLNALVGTRRAPKFR
jgi:hypothetical protein